MILKAGGVPADKKISIIKEVRALTGLGLKEAKDLVEAGDKAIKENVSNKDKAAKIKKQITGGRRRLRRGEVIRPSGS